MRDRPTKTHTQSHDKEKKKDNKRTQNSKICTAVKVAHCKVIIEHHTAETVKNQLAQQIV